MKRHIKPETQAVLITPPASGMQNDDDWKTPCGFSDDSYQKKRRAAKSHATSGVRRQTAARDSSRPYGSRRSQN